MVKRRLFPTRLILLGPQGSGKGTQATILSKKLHLPHVSTGDIFRQHLKYRTSLGKRITALLDAGKLVPDRLVNAVVRERLHRPDCRRGYLFDGYPRTTAQARFLQRLAPPQRVVELTLSDGAAVRRISGRRMAPDGTIYHLKFHPAPKHLRKQLVIRDDDRPQAVRKRLRLYRKQTEPLLALYRRQGILEHIDARPAIPAVTQQIIRTLRNHRSL